MGRILGIDYGIKRTGIAVSDPLKIIANSLTTIDTKELLKFITNYILKESVEVFVVGMPKTLNNKDSQIVPKVRDFVEALEKNFSHIPVRLVDERFTSKIAMDTLIMAGTSKKYRKEKGNIDKVSATIILQDFLNHNSLS